MKIIPIFANKKRLYKLINLKRMKKLISPNGFMIYDATGLKKKESDAGEYFHMNFGLRDGTDSWYYGFKHNIKDSYINKQKILTVKKK